MTACSNYRNRFTEYYYGEMGKEEERELKEHLSGCSRCLYEFNKLGSLLDAIPRDTGAGPTDSIRNRMKESLRSKTHKASMKTYSFPGVRWIPTLASAVIILFAGVLTFQMVPINDSRKGEIMTEEEMEVAENLDMLENLDLIEILEALEEIIRPPGPESENGGEL